MLFEKLLLLLLKSKVAGVPASLLATALVVSTTGFVVTGTVTRGESDEDEVNLVVQPLEGQPCIDALVARTTTLWRLEELAADADQQLRSLRARAREQADEQHKLLDEAALRTEFETTAQAIRDEFSLARERVLAEANLAPCEDRDPNTGVALDLADLRRRYDQVVRDFGTKLKDLLDDAQAKFDELVATAPQRPPRPDDASVSGSGSGD